MATGKDPEIGVRLNTNGFVSGAKKATDAVSKLGKVDLSPLTKKIRSIGGSLAGMATKLAVGATAAAAAGVAGAGALIYKGVTDAMEDEKIKDRAIQVFGAQNFDFLDETSEKIKSAFGIDDGDTRKAMTLLGEMGMSAEQAGNSMSLAADISRAKNMSIEQSAKLLGKAFQGNEGAAKKLGIQIEKTGDPIKDQARLMDALQAKFGGAAAAYAKNLPPFERTKVAISDMIKAIGSKLMPLVIPFIEWLSNSLTGILQSEGFGNFVDRIASGFKLAWGYAKTIGTTLITYGIAFFDIIKQLPATLGKMWDSGALIDWFIAILGALMKNAWDGIVMLGGLIRTGLMDGVPMLMAFIGKSLTDILRSVLGEKLSDKLGLGKVSDTFNTMMKDSGSKLAENAGKAFSEYGAKAKENFAGVGEVTKSMFSDAGLDINKSIDQAKQKTSGMLNFGDSVKAKMAQDTQDVYGMTGKASQSIGMNRAAAANAQAKNKEKLKKGAEKMNKQSGLNLNINLQASERLNPIVATT